MTGAIKKKVSIIDQALQNASRTWEIRHWKQTKPGGCQLPSGKEQDRDGDQGAHCMHPLAQSEPERLKGRGADGGNKQGPQEISIQMGFRRWLFLGSQPVESERECDCQRDSE